LWKIYSGSEGIAIRTTRTRLEDAIGSTVKGIGKVSYADFRTATMDGWPSNLYSYALQKRREYSYECEVRALAFKTESNAHLQCPNGMKIPADLVRLIDAVVISPAASSWLHSSIVDITKKYNYQWPIQRSNLTELHSA